MKINVHKFAVFTAASTFLLVLVGGLVNPTGSSLACPDWPLCHGEVFPHMTGGVLFEHSHRLVAGFVILLSVLLWRQKQGRLGLAAVAIIAVQALLGGLTVLLKLPPEVSIAHLAVSQIFLAAMLFIAVRTSPAATARPALPAATRGWVIAAAATVYVQILLGAVVRHMHAAYACLDQVPLCFGMLWPPNIYERVHMIHRFGAVVTALVVVIAAVQAARALPARSFPRRLALAAPVLVLVQIFLGVWTVWSWKGLPQVEAHLGVGAALWSTLWLLTVTTRGVAAAREPAALPAAAAVQQ